jgi:hypothetical protein
LVDDAQAKGRRGSFLVAFSCYCAFCFDINPLPIRQSPSQMPLLRPYGLFFAKCKIAACSCSYSPGYSLGVDVWCDESPEPIAIAVLHFAISIASYIYDLRRVC